MKQPEEISAVIVKAIERQFPKDKDKILKELDWDSIMGCYYFWKGDIFYGVETDGYIHT